MWNLHLLSTAYHQRPSTIAGITDTWAAYQFDFAVLNFARYVEGQLDKKQPLERILAAPTHVEPPSRSAYGSFRQLGAMRTMKVPESGVW